MTSGPNQPNQDPNIELTLAADFRAALRVFLRRTEEVAAANGLTPQRYDLLIQIHAGGTVAHESTVTELTERLSLGQTAVTELVKRAEQAGLVTRHRDADDGRVWRLRLTRTGRRRLTATFDALRSDRRALLDTFTRAGRRLHRLPRVDPRQSERLLN
jgi:DNA-binding MarR family transcriptional regulator